MEDYAVFQDAQRHTCIRVKCSPKGAEFIPFETTGYEVCTLSHKEFEMRYSTKLEDYPVQRAALTYLGATWVPLSTKADKHLKYLAEGKFENDVQPIDFEDKESVMTEELKQEMEAKAGKPKAAKPKAKPAAKKAAPKAKPEKVKVASKAAAKPAKAAAAPEKAPVKVASKAAAKPAKAEKPKATKAKGVGKSRFADTDKIVVVSTDNPYKDGTKASETFKLFKKASTVAKYKELCAAAGDKVDKAYINYASRDGYITVG